MKKLFIICLILFNASIAIWSEGLTGIFGIEFGKTSAEVKDSMNAKGWKLKKTDGTTLYFEKNNGTYANLKVSDIKFYFYEDKFYDAFISFPVKTKTDDIIDALIAIQESCNLTSVSEDKKKYEGYDILLYKFADPQLNTFSLMIMGRGSIFISSFVLTNFEIYSEKNAAEEKRKEEETAKKNKSISSDL